MTSLYDSLIPTYLQILRAAGAFLAKGAEYAREKGISQQDLLARRLADDMHPLAFQIRSIVSHSAGAIERVTTGSTTPAEMPTSIDEAVSRIAAAVSALEKVKPEQLEAAKGKTVVLTFGTNSTEYLAENYLLSFALQNFFFHTTTAYAILRNVGVPLGKRDFMGQVRTK